MEKAYSSIRLGSRVLRMGNARIMRLNRPIMTKKDSYPGRSGPTFCQIIKRVCINTNMLVRMEIWFFLALPRRGHFFPRIVEEKPRRLGMKLGARW
jgi:hypothetical protein